MAYLNQHITVPLDEFGPDLYAKFLNPKLQPASVQRAQQMQAISLAARIPPEFRESIASGGMAFETLTTEQQEMLTPLLVEQTMAQHALLGALVVDWNVTDPFTDEILPPPRNAENPADILDRAPAAVVQAIYNAIQEAMTSGPDPTFSKLSSS